MHPVTDPRSRAATQLEELNELYDISPDHRERCDMTRSLQQTTQLDRFVGFLLVLYPLLEHTLSPVDPFLGMVHRRPDFYLPFRELAPSRVKVTAVGGPYSLGHLLTRAGFFSVLVFRTITFSTPFLLQDDAIFFNNLDEFNAAIDPSRPAAHFCDVKCYGTPDPRRSPLNASKLWDLAARWTSFVMDDDGNAVTHTLTEFNDFLVSLRAPCLGRLQSYLTAADYSYTPLVAEPTPSEVASIAFKMGKNAGARKGLQDLGLIRVDGDVSKEDFIQSFQTVFDYSFARLGELRHRMQFDAVMLEHALCKYSRLKVKKRDLDMSSVSVAYILPVYVYIQMFVRLETIPPANVNLVLFTYPKNLQ
ncbi:hypothetical protein BXZ70DRAFT_889519 [Cristinia sonorae]|uniref:Uncharacterized protein n=1 Tax=Cristinia sonorae TaxID=1940300 RepID=A0A8K0XSL9_9AGAR|nr:hypothetical protein BXZ70DRAFT_889519 [Cristinia sonorae]